MYAIRLPSGDFLDVPRNFGITYDLQNQVFATSRTDVLPGSYSFPADLPLSPRNQVLLSNPQAVSNASKWVRIPNVEIYCHGAPLFKGELRITECSAKRVRITVISNPVSPIKDVPLNTLDLEGERGLGGFDENMALFAATAERPEEYDFAVFPVYAPQFDEQDADIVDNNYVNWWYDEEYTFSFDSVALIPFPRVDYVLRRMFEQHIPDYLFINAWQNSEELKRLYILNNFDARRAVNDVLEITYQIDLRNHVGEMKANAFLRAIMARFCLGLFSSPFQRKIVLRALRDVIQAPAAHDWTEYLYADYTISDDEPDTPMKFCDPQFDQSTSMIDDAVDLPSFSSAQEFQSALSGLADGYYYVEALEMVYYVSSATGPTLAYETGRKRRCVVLADTPVFDAGIYPTGTSEFPAWGHFPWYEQKGSYWQNDGTDGNPEWVRYKNTFEPQLVFYRGFQESVGAVIHDRPYASNDVWRPDAKPLPLRAKITSKAAGPSGAYTVHGDAQYSLLWAGQYGLYETWWRWWHNMLRHGKHITFQFALPVAALTEFSFEQKIRVFTIDYMVKKLRVGKALSNSRVLVEASLLSTI